MAECHRLGGVVWFGLLFVLVCKEMKGGIVASPRSRLTFGSFPEFDIAFP